MATKDQNRRFQLPQPREMTSEAAMQITRESRRCRRELEQLTKAMERLDGQDYSVIVR
jgi:hypothetical protein